MKRRNRQKLINIGFAILLALCITLMGLNLYIEKSPTEIPKVVLTVGNQVDAFNGSPDYLGTTDVQVQQALNALPATGGEIDLISPAYTFAATVSRAINYVTIKGNNGTVISWNGVSSVFSVGSQTGWKFQDLRVDSTITNYNTALLSNVTLGATYYTLRPADGTSITGNITGNAGTATSATTATNQSGGTVNATSVTDSGLTSGRVPFAGTNGLLGDSSSLTYNSGTTTFSAPTINSTTTNANILNAPTGRTATIVIASNDSPSIWKAQADKTLGASEDIGAYINSEMTLGFNSFKIAPGNPYWSTSIIPSVASVWIDGSGIGDYNSTSITTLKLANNSNCHGILAAAGPTVRILYLSNLALDGNKASQVGNWDGIQLNAYLGIGGGEQVGLFNVIVQNWTRDGINNISSIYGINAVGLMLMNNGQDGLCDTGSAGSVIQNAWAFQNGRHGFYLNGINYKLDLFAESNGSYGVYLTSCQWAQLNVSCIGNGLSGCVIYNSSDIQGNIISLGNATFCHVGSYWGYCCDVLLSNSSYLNLSVSTSYSASHAWNIGLEFDTVSYSTIRGDVASKGLAIDIHTTASCLGNIVSNSIIKGDTSTVTFDAVNKDSYFKFVNNQGYISAGEIKTFSGVITGSTAGTLTSLDNPFGQSVRVLNVEIEVTTQSVASGTLDVGIGTANNGDYSTMFSALPTDVGTTYPYFYVSNVTPTYGVQTIPINWASGSGNRYLNFYNKATNTNLVATYTITIMGN